LSYEFARWNRIWDRGGFSRRELSRNFSKGWKSRALIVVCARLLQQLTAQVPVIGRDDYAVKLGQLQWRGNCRSLISRVISSVRKHTLVGTRLPVERICDRLNDSSQYASAFLRGGFFHLYTIAPVSGWRLRSHA
jgi:hypothetical protein